MQLERRGDSDVGKNDKQVKKKQNGKRKRIGDDNIDKKDKQVGAAQSRSFLLKPEPEPNRKKNYVCGSGNYPKETLQ